MTQYDICHICLENKSYEHNVLIKNCCDAFICNSCWNIIINNEDIQLCPICSNTLSIQEDMVQPRPINGIISQYTDYLHKILLIIKWLLIGYIITIIFVFIYFHNKRDYIKTMDFLHSLPYFWLLCPLYGYLFVIIYEYYSNSICNHWHT